MIDYKENVQPGVLCIVKCIEVITTCKRIYHGKYFHTNKQRN